MTRLLRHLGLTTLLIVVSTSASAQVALPDTAAGRALGGWLDAFNSEDPELLREFYTNHIPTLSPEPVIPFMTSSGGIDLVSIQNSAELSLEYVLEERSGDSRGIGLIVVNEAEPFEVIQFPFTGVPADAIAIGFLVDEEAREELIDDLIDVISERYVLADRAEAMSDSLRERQRSGEYDMVTSGDDLARLLMRHLRDVQDDPHLGVRFLPYVQSNAGPERSARDRELNRLRLEQVNCGFEAVEILPGNTGYLKLDAFFGPSECASTATAAMTFLQYSDSLVIDLRDNGGGDPSMVALLSSYFFGERTHLNDLWTRHSDTTEQFWTHLYVSHSRFQSTPVYLLTSSRTFSAAEGFAYVLQSLERAIVVGETTRGGAHPAETISLGRFSINLPYARVISPVTDSNWEGTGVTPDFEVASSEALAVTLGMLAE